MTCSDDHPLIQRATFNAYLQDKDAFPVLTAPAGRFIVPIPNFDDGAGPLLIPNIKELDAKLRGSEGHVKIVELEAGPQQIPTDGTNLLIVNRVDEFAQLALTAKWHSLLKKSGCRATRQTLSDFMSYARGYTYDAETGTITFADNIGFRNDAYNIPIKEFKQRYSPGDDPQRSLTEVPDDAITAGYYVKNRKQSRAVYIHGAFQVPVDARAGTTVQSFDDGALLSIPNEADLPISFVHVTDIDTCYVRTDGTSLLDADGGLTCLPVYEAKAIAASAPKAFPKSVKQFSPR